MQKNEGSRFSFRHEIYYLVTKLTSKFTSRYASTSSATGTRQPYADDTKRNDQNNDRHHRSPSLWLLSLSKHRSDLTRGMESRQSSIITCPEMTRRNISIG